MTEISRPWDGVSLGDAGPYSSQDWADYLKNHGQANQANQGPLMQSGTPPTPGLEVQLTSPASAGVTLKPGAAIVDGTLYLNDADLNLTIATNGSGNDRIDLLVLRKDFATQAVRAAIKQGTPAATPSPPGLTQTIGVTWEIPLADIYAANGFVSISQDNITPRHEWAQAAAGVFLDNILNNSGGTLETGDVVIVDTSANSAVTTTTTLRNNNVAGAWVGRTDNGAYGRVLIFGIGPVRVNATVARGDKLVTSTTAKRAVNGEAVNVFARALEARTGAGLVRALLHPIQAGIQQEIIGHTVLSVAAASIDIQNIPDDFYALVLLLELRTDFAAVADNAFLRFNNDSGANYYSLTSRITHSGALATAETLAGASMQIATIPAASSPTGYRNALAVTIWDYASATRMRRAHWNGGANSTNATGNIRIEQGQGLWTNAAAALNRLTIFPGTGPNFIAGSAYALLGLAGV